MQRGQPNVGSPQQMGGTPRDWKSFRQRTALRYGFDEAIVVVPKVVAADKKGCLSGKQGAVEFSLDPLSPPGWAHSVERVLCVQCCIPEGELETFVETTKGAASCRDFDASLSWPAKFHRIGITVYGDGLDT